ncbi:M15 family metallopeptidase [Flammeovirga sp. OC4]|uniref:M15 family metallopeptidase n=1 Tax=Flammeovirga sp. OC4 TaxID=1382345 RepID=UPI0005C6DA46|nr:M15 family metallopeptidase [Flammeovirga sp. OC4]
MFDKFVCIFFLFLLTNCTSKKQETDTLLYTIPFEIDTENDENILSIIKKKVAQDKYWQSIRTLSDSSFVEMIKLDSMFVLDIRYATDNNFTKKVLYPCPKALLRKKVALQLIKVQHELLKKGYRIKLFDCYRPLSVQWKMWEAYPDRRYVADPKKGSWHNKGSAVDLTLCTMDGKQVDMGTTYDYFGKEAWPDYQDLPQNVLANRRLLAETMWKFGFGPTSTEWWHYSYRLMSFPISDHPLNCE